MVGNIGNSNRSVHRKGTLDYQAGAMADDRGASAVYRGNPVASHTAALATDDLQGHYPILDYCGHIGTDPGDLYCLAVGPASSTAPSSHPASSPAHTSGCWNRGGSQQ